MTPEDRLDSDTWAAEDGESGPYFAALGDMEQAISRRDFVAAAAAVRRSLDLIPTFVQSMGRLTGQFRVPSIPALERGGTVLALAGDRTGLAAMLRLVRSVPLLDHRISSVESHLADLDTLEAIVAAVLANPGFAQTSIKTLIGAPDGRRVANLIAWLEKAGRIQRKRNGSSWTLHPQGAPGAMAALPAQRLSSHRRGKPAIDVQPLELGGKPYVSLPRSPHRWEERRDGRVPEQLPDITEHFEIFCAHGWSVAAVEKIAVEERPDPAYRRFMSARGGLFLVDDLGKAAAFPDAPASAVRFGPNGDMVATGPLRHGVHRLSSNALGSGLIGLSKAAIVHAYDDDLRQVLETALEDAPEVERLLARTGLDSELRNYVRAVALAPEADRYLVTAVDEAWCYTLDGEAMWGRRLPHKQGWTRIAEPGGAIGTSEDVQAALGLMGLELPVSAEQIKQRFRTLAKDWHPDLRPDDPDATRRMQDLGAAAEVLTGVDASALGHYTGARYEQVMSASRIKADDLDCTIFMSMVGGEADAADWIYAASFAGHSREVFLAGYSGKVVHLDQAGLPLRVYDIGSVPRSIADTGDFLYVLTDTRLYVLQGDVLHALIDTQGAGEVIVGETGFALIENRRLRWYRENGEHLGSVIAKEPIRRAYHTGEDLVVETRQRRARIANAPCWWESADSPAAGSAEWARR